MNRFKYLIPALSAVLILCSFAAAAAASPVQIETTIFPEYDWGMNILGENPAGAEVTLLMDNGVDLHSYQPTAVDILKIADCDLFIYVGGASDEWVEDALKETADQNQTVLDLLSMLGDSVKEEELVEGMQETEHAHHHDGDAEEEHKHQHDEHEETEYDEHVWLSLKNAAVLCGRDHGCHRGGRSRK